MVSVMCSFRGTMIISEEYSQPPFLSTTLYNFLTLNLQSSTFAKALSFSVFQNTIHHETNFSSKQLYFQSSIDYTEMRPATWCSYFFCKIFFFKTPICLVELLLSNNYFLVTNTLSDQLLL